MMFYINLNFFNTIRGPQILCYYPSSLEEERAQQIANLLNISELIKQKFFVYETSPQFKTVNYYFEIPSEWARGKKEMLLLSLILIDEPLEQIHVFEDLLKKIETKIGSIKNAYKGFYLYDVGHDAYNEIEEINNHICQIIESFIPETKETIEKSKIASLSLVMERDVEKKIGSYIIDSNFFDFLFQIEKNDRPFVYLSEVVKYGIPIFLTDLLLPTIKVPEKVIFQLLKNIRIFKMTNDIIANIKSKISSHLKDSSLSLIALAESLSSDASYQPVNIVSDDFDLIQFVHDYYEDVKVIPCSSFMLELINNVKDQKIREYFDKIRKKIINIEMQQALEQKEAHPSDQLSWLIEKAINAATSSISLTSDITDEINQLPKVDLSFINLYTKGHVLQEPQLKRIQDLLPFLDDLKEVIQNFNEVQKYLTQDEMENANILIHDTLNILNNTFLLSEAVLRDRRKHQFRAYLAKMIANFEFLAAVSHTDLGEIDQAIDHFTQSALQSTIAGKQSNVVIANYLKSLSLVHKNQYKNAQRQFEITRSLSENYKIPRYDVMAMGGIAIVKFLLGDLDEAKEMMNEVHKLIENDEQESLQVLNEFGDNFYMMGRPDVAIHLYNEAFEIAIKLKRITMANIIYSKIRRSYYATGSFDNILLGSQLHKILDLAYFLKSEEDINFYKQKIDQLEKIREIVKEPLPFQLNTKSLIGENLPNALKEWMDLLHVTKEQKQLTGKKEIQFTNFFCYNPRLGNLVVQIPEDVSLRFERVPEAYRLALKTHQEKYSIIEASDKEKEKYLIRLIIVTKSMDNIQVKRVAPQVIGKFLEL